MTNSNPMLVLNSETLTARVHRVAVHLACIPLNERQQRYVDIVDDMKAKLSASGASEQSVWAAVHDFCGLAELVLGLIDAAAIKESTVG